jgi:diadenosine tetraphosphate (Ap4A) HIT family hydrolase
MTNFVNESSAERPGNDSYAKLIRQIAEDGVCPFCPEHFVYHPNPIDNSHEYWSVTDSGFPYENTSHHSLLVHKAHIETLDELETEAWAELLMIIRGITRAKNLAGGAMVFRYGDTRFNRASVAHLHLQVVSGSGDPDKPVITRIG